MFFLILISTYSFTVIAPDTVQYINPQDEAIFDFELHNTGTDDDEYELYLKGIDFPTSWAVLFCYSDMCLASGLPYKVYEPIPSGESDTNVSVHVLTDDLDTTGIMEFTITSQADTTLAEKYNLYVITSSGIEEFEEDIKEKVIFMAGVRNLDCDVYDVNGRKVNNLESGIYFIKADEEDWKKVVIIR